MKFWSLILAVYILALGIVPCADAASFQNQKQEVTISTLMPHHEAQHQDDFCTPFCACSCCHINVDQPVFTIQLEKVFIAEGFSKYIDLSFYTLPIPIWQPPKI